MMKASGNEHSVKSISDIVKNNRNLGHSICLLIGAGTSVSAGIPLAHDIVQELKKLYPNVVAQANEESYFGYMEALPDGLRHKLVSEWLGTNLMNMSHLCIAALVRHGYVDRILTTNFDSCTERALDFYGVPHYQSYDLASRTAPLEPERLSDVSIVHLHGKEKEMLFLNTEDEIREIANNIGNLFEECNKNRTWIVVGYSGNDKEAVFDKLSSLQAFPNGLYWVGYNQYPPEKHIERNILSKRGTAFVRGEDSDSFFEKLAKSLHINVDLLDYYRPKTHVKLEEIDGELTDIGKKEASYIFKTIESNIQCIAYKIINVRTKNAYLHRIFIEKERFDRIRHTFLENREINIIKTLVETDGLDLLPQKTHQFTPTSMGSDALVLKTQKESPAMLHSQITYCREKGKVVPLEFLMTKYTTPISMHGNLIDKQPKYSYKESKTAEDILRERHQKELIEINRRFFYPFTHINMHLPSTAPFYRKKPASDRPEKLLRLVVVPETRCNYSCTFCCQTSRKSSRTCKPGRLPDIIGPILGAMTETGCTRIMLTGGEPLLADKEGLKGIIRAISRHGGISDFWLCTNGSLLTRPLCEDLYAWGLRKIVVSVGADSNAKYKQYTRQSAVSLDHVLARIADAIKAGLHVRVDVPLHKNGIQNIKEFLALIAQLKAAGVKEVAYFKLHKTSCNELVFEELFVEPDVITWELANDSSWQLLSRPNGQKVFKDKTMDIIVPASNVKLTDHCKHRNCGDYCQGTYAAYVKEHKARISLQACHHPFPENTREIDFSAIAHGSSGSCLVQPFREMWAWAYETGS